MKCSEFFDELKKWAARDINPETTCDTFKCGDESKEVHKVAMTMFATPDVVREALEWGAELLIVHEPVCYEHHDNKLDTFIALEKKKFLDESGIVIFRFHDYAHAINPDLIYEGEIKALGLKGERVEGSYFAVNSFILDEEMTALELAKLMEEKLGLKHVRIAGNPNAKGKKISCSFGTPGHLEEAIADNDILLTGEINEWHIGEMVRDYAQLGYNKAAIVMTHVGSERAGMALLKEKLDKAFPDMEFRYIECGELYSYTD